MFWDSTPIGRSIELCLCKYEQFSPQLILEDKVFRSIIHLQNQLQIKLIGTLITDDESRRLTYVIDRLIGRNDSNHHHHTLTGEFIIPIQLDKKSLIQDGIKEIEIYCHSLLPMELHRFLYLCGQISSRHSSSIDLSFDLVTIKNNFILTPINSDRIQIIPTALLKTNNSKTQPCFGYCSLDELSQNKIVLIHENDPQACTLPLVGIWISGINDIQCTFVWSACLRYYLNSSLKQRLRSGINSQQSFLLVCYTSTSYNQCIFYEVYSTSSMNIEYDLWKCSQQISIPNSSSYQYDTQFPYDFQFKRVYNQPARNYPSVEISPNNHLQVTLTSPNTNGSLFGFPRLPPQQSSHPSPSWDSISTTPMTTTPQRILKQITTSPVSPTIVPTDTRWKEEFIERMQSYETHIQSLTALVTQLLLAQQTSISTPIKESTKCDVAVQSESSSSYINDQPLTPPVIHQHQSIVDDSTILPDVNPVDILKPIFQFIDKQQQSVSLPTTANNSNDTTLIQSQQQHVTTTTTGISLFTNGVQMQFINQQSSTTTVIPQAQLASPPPPLPSPAELLVSPQKSENNLSIEVHGLEMKYLEDDQLAVAIECDRQSKSPQIVNKSLSFGTKEYLQRYGLFNESNTS